MSIPIGSVMNPAISQFEARTRPHSPSPPLASLLLRLMAVLLDGGYGSTGSWCTSTRGSASNRSNGPPGGR